MNILLEIIILILLVFHLILLLLLFAARRKQGVPVLERLDSFEPRFGAFETRLGENERVLGDAIRGEFGRNREESSKGARDSREELTAVFTSFTGMLDGKLRGITDSVAESARGNRDELAVSLKSFEDKFAVHVGQFNDVQKEKFTEISANQSALTREAHEIFDRLRDSIEKKLVEIQNDNSVKLEKMRETVDEKLHQTLETRLGESFKIVSDRLELVQKGLGEMQTLATGVGDLKKVLTNVKTKGVLGEYQLEGILEQMLTIDQYGKNVKTKQGSNDVVEFAVKIPAKDDSAKIIWLPIDSKFPTEDYERLNAAYDAGSSEDIERHKKELERKIKTFAKDIKSKYVDPPHTTDFAIMFLPFEGLYAEVLRIPNLFRSVQDEFKITITGPTTVSAFLSSLQMGFRSLAVEKRTSEIWELLGAVRTEFGKFGDVLEKTKEKLESASKEIDKAGTRSRAIERRLRDVQSLPGAEASKLLGADDVIEQKDELF